MFELASGRHVDANHWIGPQLGVSIQSSKIWVNDFSKYLTYIKSRTDLNLEEGLYQFTSSNFPDS